ncbi:hypothetical protein AeNC1_010272 [Aphanomyces euteiches]|nr:hypothetical protein AeNC1_010272 [Aphanomyces euteiches]
MAILAAASLEVCPSTWSKGGDGCRFVHNECSISPMFKSEYIRNNRSSGHKNVRCFPHCCGAHRESTFCGSSISVQSGDMENLVVYGRFEEDSAKMQPHIEVGATIALSQILGDEKTASNPFGMWMVGVPIGNRQYEINKSKLSWHYGWVSSRFNSKTLHRFRVYFFQQASPQQLNRKTRKKSSATSSVGSGTPKAEPTQSPPLQPPAPMIKSEPFPATIPPPQARPAPHPIKIEIPSFDTILRHDAQRPRTFPSLDNVAKRLKVSMDDNPQPPLSPTTSTFQVFYAHLAQTKLFPALQLLQPPTHAVPYSFSSFLRGQENKPSSPVPSQAPSCAFSFSSFLRPTNLVPPVKPAQPGSPVPSSVPSGVRTLFSDLVKEDFCRKTKEKKRVSRYDYVERAVVLHHIHTLATSITGFTTAPEGKWNCLAESQTPMQGFFIRTGEWENISIYECRPRAHKTDETYEQVLTFCVNAMRHAVRTGFIGRLRSFLHSHASCIFKPELLDQAYADFIIFFEQEIESYVFPRKNMQCAAFLAYLRRNLPLEMLSLIDGTPTPDQSDNEPLGYFDLVTQLRRTYHFVKSSEEPVDTKPSSVSRTLVTGRWRRERAPTATGNSWFYRVLGSKMLKLWTLVETPNELYMKFDDSLIPAMTAYLLNGNPMFLSFSPIGMATGGTQGRAMDGYKAWRDEKNRIVVQWYNWPRGSVRRRFSRTLYRSETDPNILCSITLAEESSMSEEELKAFADMSLSERINFPGEWKVNLQEDSTFVRLEDDQ